MAAIFIGLGDERPMWTTEIIGKHQEKSHGKVHVEPQKGQKRVIKCNGTLLPSQPLGRLRQDHPEFNDGLD